MSTPFDGQWTDKNNDTITITSNAQVLSAKYSNGRGPFTGVAATLGAPVVYINFTDDAAFTGVLTTDHNQILWSNTTVWKKR